MTQLTTPQQHADRTAQMRCPKCNHQVHEVHHPKKYETKAFYCPDCGWGKDKAADLSKGIVQEEQHHMNTQYIILPSYIRIGLSLIASTVLLAIPYILFVTLWPFGASLPIPFHIAYWLLAIIYLAASYFEDPRIYEDWDVWAFDNPFKINDETNQTSTILTILLIPGKLLVWSITALLGRTLK
ncbi:hypothetical protein JD969_12080 [Planctomycetota bacterium]|nr:hypothetical protein JD969_12080 [Planctomycetota bacterium]